MDVVTGAFAFLFSVPFTHNMLENAPDGTLLTAERTGTGTQFYSIDLSTGVSTPLGFTEGIDFSGLAFAPEAAVPFPATLLLVGVGLMGGLIRRSLKK